MVGETEKNVLQKTLSHLWKKGAFYRSPQKLAITACLDRRLRCKSTGDSGQGRRFRLGSGLLPDRGLVARHTWVIGVDRRFRSRGAGDSGQTPVKLCTPIQYRTTKRSLGSEKQWTGDSGSFGPETPVGPETPYHLRCSSGPDSNSKPELP